MNFISVIIAGAKNRSFAWLTLAMLLGVLLTVRLGFWQLSRADEKQARHTALVTQMQAPELSTAELLAQPDQFGSLHQRVALQGRWLSEHTRYLDNRPMNGRAGFWVLTPLQLNASTVVLVQRGWVPRHSQDRLLLPEVQTPSNPVQVNGRIALAPSNLMNLGDAEPSAASASAKSESETSANAARIQQNVDLAQEARRLGAPLAAVVLQTDAAADGLLRDWPAPNAGFEKNLAYAFQWFALAALQLMLYIWFQLLQPYRHARRSSR